MKEVYLQYVRQALEHGRATYAESVERWRNAYNPKQFFGMYMPPAVIPVQAHLEGFLYRVTGEVAYAEHARTCLLDIASCMSVVTEEQRRTHPEYEGGIPAMEAAFQSPHYSYGYLHIKDSGVLSDEEKRRIEEMIASSIRTTFYFPEWGAHNRSMLRVWGATLAARAIGVTEETTFWNKLCDQMAQDSFGGWSIEDAQAYMNLWLIGTMEYAKYRGREREYYALPQTKYYFDFIARLITPYGQVPDFGDSNFNATWYLWLPILEKGAAVYRDGHMKYAARKLWEFAMASSAEEVSLTAAVFLALAHQWADDEVEPVRPDRGSEEVLEDLVGKKIVFRSGWDEDASYLLLNYRDEGPYALVARDYLRTTIPVKAEKMHHGHSDENAIVLLVVARNVLLHDGGYRENVPNGKYRADLYHNRLVFRSGDAAPADIQCEAGMLPGQTAGVYDRLHDDGFYKPASTERLHFQRFERLDYSRTRLHDKARRLVWDRLIVFVKQGNAYIVVDWVKSDADQQLTTGNLWHTGKATQLAPGCFETHVPYIHRGVGCVNPYRNLDEWSLLIEFPQTVRATGWENIRRNYGDGVMVYETDTKPMRQGEMSVYVTALTPCKRAEAAGAAGRTVVRQLPAQADTLALAYTTGESTLQLAFKLDLGKGLLAEPIFGGSGPRYTWEDGRIDYGDIVTDADFAFAEAQSGSIRYGFVNGSALHAGGKPLFTAPVRSTFVFDETRWETSHHKWRAWEGEESV
ncbi:hypothetical protein [Paenibacillus cymbidii]|uniref:hypothetical protein n=1 Tax=Paenibacillus cymbidii TaxID=1639034 RepID=UPI0010806F19|nr:hypothetical protein [Paenibacillus cymbidii]